MMIILNIMRRRFYFPLSIPAYPSFHGVRGGIPHQKAPEIQARNILSEPIKKNKNMGKKQRKSESIDNLLQDKMTLNKNYLNNPKTAIIFAYNIADNF